MRTLEEQIAAANLGINGLQYGILRALSEQSFTLSELSKKFMLDPSTLVPVVDTLESKGYILRGKDPADRRRTPLFTTDQGKAVLNRVPFSPENDMLYRCMNELGEAKANALLAQLREVILRLPGGAEMLQEIETRVNAYSCDQPASPPADSTS